jgi:hypothetical protein
LEYRIFLAAASIVKRQDPGEAKEVGVVTAAQETLLKGVISKIEMIVG